MTEIFTTSDGVIVAENRNGIYEPDCLIRGDEICIPTVGGVWIPSMRIDG
jgi:hypothetical protein